MKKRVTFALEEDLIVELKTISKETMIPQSRLVEKAVEDLLVEEQKKIDEGAFDV
ncbi:ribbon-helix-helix domain-containing protein [Oenococcus kitaharae]|uniref:Predicted DNA-binding protein ribbon-helix-helix domain-containing protein n=1 Tax=Oenococcus kitaharae DSM 17330 TaxID=1045004 RepID=G9WIN1_9LACO|nr:ribbon-helix-helix domain-containing protein [Oenococcus kitaharae]EHN58170.1 hypothetical protein OKIT_0041 [Oenococcus kitaharae DSM 17330]